MENLTQLLGPPGVRWHRWVVGVWEIWKYVLISNLLCQYSVLGTTRWIFFVFFWFDEIIVLIWTFTYEHVDPVAGYLRILQVGIIGVQIFLTVKLLVVLTKLNFCLESSWKVEIIMIHAWSLTIHPCKGAKSQEGRTVFQAGEPLGILWYLFRGVLHKNGPLSVRNVFEPGDLYKAKDGWRLQNSWHGVVFLSELPLKASLNFMNAMIDPPSNPT